MKFADVPRGLAAISSVPDAGWGLSLAFMAFCEVPDRVARASRPLMHSFVISLAVQK